MKKVISIILFVASAATACAQVVAGSSFFSEIVSNWHMGFTADFSASAALPSDLHNDASGKLAVYEGTALLKFQAVKNGHAINTSIGYTRGYFDFDQDYCPFSDTNKVYANIFYSGEINDKWSVFSLALGSLASESAADMLDGGRIVAGIGAGYKFYENLRIGLGAGAASRMDNDWIPIPLVYIDWKINDSLSLRTFDGVALIYDVFKDGTLLVNFSGQYINTDYRLVDNAYANKRCVEDSYYQIALGATYNFSKKMYVSASAGANFGRELNFRTSDVSAEKYELDAAPVFYLHFGYKF